jgi:ABC-type glycerol-3-phosphate transport system substrate-binding protein
MISHPFASKLIILLIAAGVIYPWPSRADTGKTSPGVFFGKSAKERLLNADEFLEIVKTLKAKGITPISEGFADRDSEAAIPIFNTMIRFAGYEKIRKFQQKQINFSDPDILRALNYWKTIVDAGGYNCEKSQALNLSDSVFEMMEEQAAISFSDTLSYSKFSSTKRIKGVVGVMDWFNVPQGKGNNTFGYTYGGGVWDQSAQPPR